MQAVQLKQLIGAVCYHLSVNLTSGAAVEYPGEAIDTGAINDWVRVNVASLLRPPQRRQASGQSLRSNAVVQVSIFSKRTTATYRGLEIEADVRNVLRHAEIAVRDFEDSSEPYTAHARLFEPRLSNNSSSFNTPVRSDVQVIELEFPAYVQAV